MSIFCCYANQDIVDPEVTNALTKEVDKAQDPPIDEPLITENAPLVEAPTPTDAEDEEVARINEQAAKEDQPPLEYKRIIYDSVTNTMEEIVVKILSEDIVEPQDINEPEDTIKPQDTSQPEDTSKPEEK